MLDAIGTHLQEFILTIGYFGLFLLMVAESTFVPVPSVLIMPFAGSLCVGADAKMMLPLVILMNSLGALVGSMAFYEFGARGGKPILLKVGKWFLVKPSDIDKTEAYFQKPGRLTVFIARFIPVVRHFISFVAGLGHMPRTPFVVQTVAGATIWGGFLAVLGYVLADHWMDVVKTIKKFDLAIGLSIIALAIFLFVRFWRKRKAEQAAKLSA
ncbi:MAG: DedA family protein [Deltaproteobacteria bacterium]|nr:DedA family protein [Deltaproteobacteria bacterium]